MWCSVLCVLGLLTIAAEAGHVFKYHGVEWETVGCYKDHSSPRSLRHFFHDLKRDGLNKSELKKTGYKPYFEACADKARDNDYILFGIQYFSECWGDDDPKRNYALHGAADNCHHSDVKSDFFQIGGHWSNYIYRAKPINGGFSKWGDWTKCTVKCGGGGVQIITRSCTNPKPRFQGKNCEGATTRTRKCGSNPCPVDGKWSSFSSWSKCSKTCGGGIQQQTRTCTNPPPAHGGKKCVGKDKNTRSCGTNKCSVDGKWSSFSAWSKCSKTCGGGIQQQTRTCTNPPPAHGGKKCVGKDKNIRSCGTNKCPASWKPISGLVCAEGKGRRPAVFTPLLHGTATKLKLVYKSGYIRCDNNKNHNSHWGCWDHPQIKRDGLNMVVTDSKDFILLPTKFKYPAALWYRLKGYNSKSPSLVLGSNVGMKISKSCPLKVWYGEDLMGDISKDNDGKVCFQVYAFMLPNC